VRAIRWLATSAAVVGAVAGTVTLATANGAAARAADEPPPIVEDYAYPGAQEILAKHQLELIKGDGHLLFVTSIKYGENRQCAVGEIQVEKSLDVEPFGVYYCFRTVGTKGWLTLKVPATFGVRGGSKTVEATANLPSGPRKYTIPANSPVAIDPGDGHDTPKAVLVELRFGSA
jgi:hypothetical protein